MAGQLASMLWDEEEVAERPQREGEGRGVRRGGDVACEALFRNLDAVNVWMSSKGRPALPLGCRWGSEHITNALSTIYSLINARGASEDGRDQVDLQLVRKENERLKAAVYEREKRLGHAEVSLQTATELYERQRRMTEEASRRLDSLEAALKQKTRQHETELRKEVSLRAAAEKKVQTFAGQKLPRMPKGKVTALQEIHKAEKARQLEELETENLEWRRRFASLYTEALATVAPNTELPLDVFDKHVMLDMKAKFAELRASLAKQKIEASVSQAEQDLHTQVCQLKIQVHRLTVELQSQTNSAKFFAKVVDYNVGAGDEEDEEELEQQQQQEAENLPPVKPYASPVKSKIEAEELFDFLSTLSPAKK